MWCRTRFAPWMQPTSILPSARPGRINVTTTWVGSRRPPRLAPVGRDRMQRSIISRSSSRAGQADKLRNLASHRPQGVVNPVVVALRLGWEAVSVMGEDGPLERGVMCRLGRAGHLSRAAVRTKIKVGSTSSSGPILVTRFVGAAWAGSRPSCSAIQTMHRRNTSISSSRVAGWSPG